MEYSFVSCWITVRRALCNYTNPIRSDSHKLFPRLYRHVRQTQRSHHQHRLIAIVIESFEPICCNDFVTGPNGMESLRSHIECVHGVAAPIARRHRTNTAVSHAIAIIGSVHLNSSYLSVCLLSTCLYGAIWLGASVRPTAALRAAKWILILCLFDDKRIYSAIAILELGHIVLNWTEKRRCELYRSRIERKNSGLEFPPLTPPSPPHPPLAPLKADFARLHSHHNGSRVANARHHFR